MTDTINAEGLPSRTRLQALGGTYNLRDTGGYPAGARTSRWGKLFRSDGLHALTDDGLQALAALGVGLIIDLRTDLERATRPSRLDGLGAEVVHVPVFAGAAATEAITGVTLAQIYDAMIDDFGAGLTRAVGLIAASGEQPVLVHCTAGKDRTGLVVALALLAAGVDRAEVIEDYVITETNLNGEWRERMLAGVRAAGLEATPDLQDLISASPRPLIEHIISRIETEYGSAAAYLTGHGLTPDDLDRLRTVLIESEGAPQ